MVKRIEIGITGKALGTQYPQYVKELAISFGLKGFVHTKNDGSIKIVAEGEEDDLVKFNNALEKQNAIFPPENFYLTWHDELEGQGYFYIVDTQN